MAFVTAGRLVPVVIAEDGAAAIDVAVVQGVAVPAGVLDVVGPDDFPPDDAAPDSVFLVFDDLHHLHPMVRTPPP